MFQSRIIENIATEPYQVLLYYRYFEIADPEAYMEEHRALCKRLGLRGRIIVGDEGINGTVSGTIPATQEYMDVLHAQPGTDEMPFKVDPCGHGHIFPKLSIKVRDEIVTLGLPEEEDVDPNEITGEHLAPREFYEAMQDENAVLIDGRNNYESDLGRFKNAICPDVDNFRDFPEWLEQNAEALKGKKVLTYCTGGIRCEKLSGYFKKAGLDNVYQLDGGIINYSHDPETKGRDFEGQCYVFDQRVGVEVNFTETRKVISHCKHCGEACDRYRNCSFVECNAQTFLCENCEASFGKFCSEDCREQIS